MRSVFGEQAMPRSTAATIANAIGEGFGLRFASVIMGCVALVAAQRSGLMDPGSARIAIASAAAGAGTLATALAAVNLRNGGGTLADIGASFSRRVMEKAATRDQILAEVSDLKRGEEASHDVEPGHASGPR